MVDRIYVYIFWPQSFRPDIPQKKQGFSHGDNAILFKLFSRHIIFFSKHISWVCYHLTLMLGFQSYTTPSTLYLEKQGCFSWFFKNPFSWYIWTGNKAIFSILKSSYILVTRYKLIWTIVLFNYTQTDVPTLYLFIMMIFRLQLLKTQHFRLKYCIRPIKSFQYQNVCLMKCLIPV